MRSQGLYRVRQTMSVFELNALIISTGEKASQIAGRAAILF